MVLSPFPQAMALCERGDEAIAVGLLAEALPGSTVDSHAEEGSERPSDDPAAAAGGTAAASASLLRTVTEHEVVSICCWGYEFTGVSMPSLLVAVAVDVVGVRFGVVAVPRPRLEKRSTFP